MCVVLAQLRLRWEEVGATMGKKSYVRHPHHHPDYVGRYENRAVFVSFDGPFSLMDIKTTQIADRLAHPLLHRFQECCF